MSTPTRPSRSLDKFIVRLPPGMREQLAEAAATEGRSMNAEIVQRLEESFGATAPGVVTLAAIQRTYADWNSVVEVLRMRRDRLAKLQAKEPTDERQAELAFCADTALRFEADMASLASLARDMMKAESSGIPMPQNLIAERVAKLSLGLSASASPQI